MKSWMKLSSVSVALVLASACPLVFGQSTQKQEPTKSTTIVTLDSTGHKVLTGTIQSPDGKSGPGVPGADTFVYIGSEMAFGGGVVKGAPYSGQGVTTFTQTLSDGTHINRQTTSQVYRDSEGRTRREETIGAIGPWASGGDPIQMIHINDPVAGTAFMLNPKDRTASKMTVRINVKKPGGAAGTSGAVSGDSITMHDIVPSPPPPPGVGFAMAGRIPPDLVSTAKGQVNTESLGHQEFEGIQAEGTRTTMTIPAGQIGNDQPIQVVNERWYSPDLQVVVMTRHSDPRTGEEVYKLTNISRAEPAHQLFEIPADYTIKESGDMIHNFKYDIRTSVEKKQNEQ